MLLALCSETHGTKSSNHQKTASNTWGNNKTLKNTTSVENLALAIVDLDREDNRSPAVIKFQRTMRRLSILRRFANSRGLEFDIENMEISMLTKPKDDD